MMLYARLLEKPETETDMPPVHLCITLSFSTDKKETFERLERKELKSEIRKTIPPSDFAKSK